MTPQERDNLFKRAETLRINGDYDNSLPLYVKLLEAHPRDHGAMIGRAYCELNMGLFDEAIETFRAAKFVDPRHIKGRMELGKAMAMLGMYPDAKREFKIVLLLDPGNSDAEEQLVYFPDDIDEGDIDLEAELRPARPAEAAAVEAPPQASPESEPATQEAVSGDDAVDEAADDEPDETEFF